jgi:hypothetical protein
MLPDLFMPASIHTYKKYLNLSGDQVPLRPLSLASDQIAAGSPGISEIYRNICYCSCSFSSLRLFLLPMWLADACIMHILVSHKTAQKRGPLPNETWLTTIPPVHIIYLMIFTLKHLPRI